MQKFHLVLLFFTCNLFLFSSCKKTDSQKAVTKLVLFTKSFTELNNDKGVVVVLLSQTGTRQSGKNYVFRYHDTSTTHLTKICNEFAERILLLDSLPKSYHTIGEYVSGFFAKPATFKGTGSLTGFQLYNLFNSSSFEISLNKKPSDESLAFKLFKGVFSEAKADPPHENGTPGNVISFIASSITGGIVEVSNASEIIMGDFLATIGLDIGTLSLTGESLTTASGSAILGDGLLAESGIGFIAMGLTVNQLNNTWNHAAGNVVNSSLNSSYEIPNDRPETLASLFAPLVDAVNTKIHDLQHPGEIYATPSLGPVVSVTANGAVLKGSNAHDRHYLIHTSDLRGVVVSQSSIPSFFGDILCFAPYGIGEYSVNVNGLMPNTKYFYRSFNGYFQPMQDYIAVSSGIGSFTTAATNPGGGGGNPVGITTVSTAYPPYGATNIGRTSATSGGIFFSHDFPVTTKGVCWKVGGGESPTTNDAKTNDGSGATDYNSSLTGLLPDTYYTVRAYIVSGSVTYYDDGHSFKTLP